MLVDSDMAFTASSISRGEEYPQLRTLGHRPTDQPIKCFDFRRSTERWRIMMQDRVQNIDEGIAAKGLLAGEHFIKDATRRENIGRRAGWAPIRLLRSHVLGGANNHASGCHDGCGYSLIDGSGRINGSRQTEIEQLDAMSSQESIGGFQVSMNYTDIMKGLKRFQYLSLDTNRFRGCDGATREPVRQ